MPQAIISRAALSAATPDQISHCILFSEKQHQSPSNHPRIPMNQKSLFPCLLLTTMFATSALADDVEKRIKFAPGASQAVVSDTVNGRDGVIYKLNAREGQFLQVEMLPGVEGADFNIFIPGRGPGEEALYNSSTGGRKYVGQLYKSGDHSILVYLNRAAARRGESADYKLLVRVTDKKPMAEEKPAVGAVPQKVIDDCLAKLKAQVPGREMSVLRAFRGENSFVVDVQVAGVPKPWRCFHSGTECTGLEYQGEG